MSPSEFAENEKKVLRVTQADLPDSETPFAELAREAGISEQEVLELLHRLKEKGYIRRFGATLRHQQAGYGHNAMVAWFVHGDDNVQRVGKIMAARPEITHCYERDSCLDWPYNLYTMVHGRNREECMRVVKELVQETGVDQYEMLFSYEELKKTSMQYF